MTQDSETRIKHVLRYGSTARLVKLVSAKSHITARTAFIRAHTCPEAADVVIIKQCPVTYILPRGLRRSSPPPNYIPKPNIIGPGLLPKSNGLFCSPCAIFPPDFVKIN